MKWLFIREFRQEIKSVFSSIIWSVVVLFAILLIFVLKKSLIGELANFINTMILDISEFLKMDFPAVTDLVWSFIWFVVIFAGIYIVWENLLRAERIFLRDEQNRQVYIMCNQIYSRKQLIITKILISITMSVLVYVLWSFVIILINAVGFKLQVINSLNISKIVEFEIVWFAINVLLMILLFLYVILRKKKSFVNKFGFFVIIMLVNFCQIKFGINLLIQAGGSVLLSLVIMLLCVVLYEKRDF